LFGDINEGDLSRLEKDIWTDNIKPEKWKIQEQIFVSFRI